MLNRTVFYYFSPTGGTKKTGELFCQAISEKVKCVNLGCPEHEWRNRREEIKTQLQEWNPELAVIAAPVFKGRIPDVAADRIRELGENGANEKRRKAVTLAVYGVRAYEDALLELNRTAEEAGFQITASAACIAQHSMVPEVGKGRPDEADAADLAAFAQKVEEKLNSGVETKVQVPGNYPYKVVEKNTAVPLTLDSCVQCGRCIGVCPVDAIARDENGSIVTDTQTCILCLACTAVCAKNARVLPPPMKEGIEKRLGALKMVRRDNEFFM